MAEKEILYFVEKQRYALFDIKWLSEKFFKVWNWEWWRVPSGGFFYFDSYEEANAWAKENVKKGRRYRIKKIIVPDYRYVPLSMRPENERKPWWPVEDRDIPAPSSEE